MHHHDGDAEFWNVLLEREVSINRQEYVKFFLSSGKERAIRNAGPTLIVNRANLDASEMGGQARIHALIEEHSQAALCTASLAACSRNATTCARRTDGNPTKNSSILSPASR